MKKVLTVVGAVTVVAAVVAYVAHDKYSKEYTDRILQSGMEFHTVDVNEKRNMKSSPFYASYTKRDQIIYEGLHGKQLLSKSDNKVYDITTKATKDLKIPSRKKAAEVFSDLYKNDSDFKKSVDSTYDQYRKAGIFGAINQKQVKLFDSVSENMTDKKLMNEGYNAFNIGLAKHNQVSDVASQKFYKKLKELGYNAIDDMNDSKYSGYKSKSPVIIFDTESIVKSKVAELSEKQINANNIVRDLIHNGANCAAYLGVGVIGGIFIGIGSILFKNKKDSDYVIAAG